MAAIPRSKMGGAGSLGQAGPVGREPILASRAPAARLAWFRQASARGRRISDRTSSVCSPSRGGSRRTRPGLSENWTGIRSVTTAPSVGCSWRSKYPV